jgi:hypothetical protein
VKKTSSILLAHAFYFLQGADRVERRFQQDMENTQTEQVGRTERVRDHHDRIIDKGPFKPFAAAPLATKVKFLVPRRSERPKLSKRKAKPKRAGRMAKLEVRSPRVQLPLTKCYSNENPLQVCLSRECLSFSHLPICLVTE